MKRLNRNFFIKLTLLFLFMSFITISTVTILYKSINISNEEYLKLLLSDTYDNNYYNKFIDFISNIFSPINVIETNKSTFNLSNRVDINPIIYIYNKNQNLSYKKEFNVTPTVMLSSYYLSEELNNKGIDTIFESNNINKFSINNNIDKSKSLELFMKDKINNYNLKYIIELGISNIHKNIRYNNKNYACISLYANRYNISLVTKLNNILNSDIPNISMIYFDDESNKNLKIDIGSTSNSMSEVLRSIKVLSDGLKEII